jgi:hypothetical protein
VHQNEQNDAVTYVPDNGNEQIDLISFIAENLNECIGQDLLIPNSWDKFAGIFCPFPEA